MSHQPVTLTSHPSVGAVLLRATGVVGVVVAASHLAPTQQASNAVALLLCLATWWFCLRGTDALVERMGLSAGGLLLRAPLSYERVGRDMVVAAGLATGVALLVFPLYALGFAAWGQLAWADFLSPDMSKIGSLRALADEFTGQVLLVALPEEVFFRGYVLSALSEALRASHANDQKGQTFLAWKANLACSALFALGHLATIPTEIGRLAVFFPSLLFGLLRQRSGGVGAAILFHAACNVLSGLLLRLYSS